MPTVRLWQQQPKAFFEEAILDADGTIAPTTGQCKAGTDMSYQGLWGYHPLLVSLANTGEPLYLVNRRGNVTSSASAAAGLLTRCRDAAFSAAVLTTAAGSHGMDVVT